MWLKALDVNYKVNHWKFTVMYWNDISRQKILEEISVLFYRNFTLRGACYLARHVQSDELRLLIEFCVNL